MHNSPVIITLGVTAWLAGCSSMPVVLDPVGPPLTGATVPLQEGNLKVYSAVETREDGDSTYYFPHTGYHIYNDSGELRQYVMNRVGSRDESPMIVKLPEGHYHVMAQADGFGRVTVPVVIKGGKLTEVNLETWGRKKTPITKEMAVVQLPNGYVVGWRAESLMDAKSMEAQPLCGRCDSESENLLSWSKQP